MNSSYHFFTLWLDKHKTGLIIQPDQPCNVYILVLIYTFVMQKKKERKENGDFKNKLTLVDVPVLLISPELSGQTFNLGTFSEICD